MIQFLFLKSFNSHHTREFNPYHTSWFSRTRGTVSRRIDTWYGQSDMPGLFFMTENLRWHSKIGISVCDFRWREVWKFNFRFELTLPKVAELNFRGTPLKQFCDMTSINTCYMQIYGSLVVENHPVWWLLEMILVLTVLIGIGLIIASAVTTTCLGMICTLVSNHQTQWTVKNHGYLKFCWMGPENW